MMMLSAVSLAVRSASRMRVAVSLTRVRATFLRSRTRTAARVSPSSPKSLLFTPVSSSASCGLLSSSAEIIITGPAAPSAGLFLKQSYIGMENEIKAQSIKMPKLSDKEFEETIQLAQLRHTARKLRHKCCLKKWPNSKMLFVNWLVVVVLRGMFAKRLLT